MLAAKLDSANGGEVIPGVVFAFAEKSISGYPFRIDVVLSGVTFANRGPDGETAWRTEKLARHTMSYRSNLLVFEAAGLQSIALPASTGRPAQVTYVTPAIARASAVLRDGKLARLDLDLWQAEGKDATPAADPKRTFSASPAQLHLLNRANDTVGKDRSANAKAIVRNRSAIPLVDCEASFCKAMSWMISSLAVKVRRRTMAPKRRHARWKTVDRLGGRQKRYDGVDRTAHKRCLASSMRHRWSGRDRRTPKLETRTFLGNASLR